MDEHKDDTGCVLYICGARKNLMDGRHEQNTVLLCEFSPKKML